jgi:hypothetical protein
MKRKIQICGGLAVDSQLPLKSMIGNQIDKGMYHIVQFEVSAIEYGSLPSQLCSYLLLDFSCLSERKKIQSVKTE